MTYKQLAAGRKGRQQREKARRAADAIHRVLEVERARLHGEGFNAGVRAHQRRLSENVVHAEEQLVDHMSGDMHHRVTVNLPTRPEGSWPVSVPFPMVIEPSFRAASARAAAPMLHTVRFRPVEQALSRRTGGSVATLRWYTWEPDDGGQDHPSTRRTTTYLRSMGKLLVAAQMVDWARMSQHGFMTTADKIAELLRECISELELALGREQPAMSREDVERKAELVRRRYPAEEIWEALR